MKFFFALISAKRPPEKIDGRLRSWNLAIKMLRTMSQLVTLI